MQVFVGDVRLFVEMAGPAQTGRDCCRGAG